MNWFSDNWPAIAALLGTGGAGAWIGKLYGRTLQHKETSRKQSDTVALDMVETLTERIALVEREAAQERALCEARQEALRLELHNQLTFADTLVLAIRHAPERALQIIEDAMAMRAERRARHDGEFHNATQARLSAARIEGDAVGAAAMGA